MPKQVTVQCESCGRGVDGYRTYQDAVAELQACGWFVCRGLFNEPAALYCDECTPDVLERMRSLRYAWQR
jgi:hypothetical protein